jgi:hypothetical protein
MTKKSIFSRINQSEEPEIDSLIQNRSNTKLIQDIESHLNSLTDSLQKGEFPVNIKKITQVFDDLVTIDRLPIDVPAHQFVDLYNDLPNILTGYAIGATLSDESYREPDVSQITFQRLDRGTYWIFPTDRIGRQGAAWLVPNPLKDIKIDRNKSLNFSFDIDSSSQNNSNILILTKPALVQILPNSDRLTWKLTERGELSTGGTASQPITANNASIDPLALTKQIEHIVQAKLRSSHGDILKQFQELIDRSTNNTIDRLKSGQIIPTSSTATSSEIVSLKIDLEKLKADYQRQQQKKDQDIAEQVRSLVQVEMTKLRSMSLSHPPLVPTTEIIESEIIETVQQRPIPNRVQVVENIQLSPLAKIYNSGEKNFLRSYQTIEASIRKPRTIIPTIELVEDRVGMYWIIPFDNHTYYLVPTIDFPTDVIYLEGLTTLFDGVDRQSHFSLFKPAIVILTKPSMPKQWKLEQKGLMQN